MPKNHDKRVLKAKQTLFLSKMSLQNKIKSLQIGCIKKENIVNCLKNRPLLAFKTNLQKTFQKQSKNASKIVENDLNHN